MELEPESSMKRWLAICRLSALVVPSYGGKENPDPGVGPLSFGLWELPLPGST